MAKTIVEILKDINKLPTRDERLKALKENDSRIMQTILRMNFDKSITCLVPEGTPPYTPAEKPTTDLAKAHDKNFLYFFKNKWSNKIKQADREAKFIRLLEAVSPAEAEMLCKAKDRSLNYIGITKKLCRDAFPDLIVE